MARLSAFLNVNDIEQSLRFYEDLGFKVTERHANKRGELHWASLDHEGAAVELGWIGASRDPEFQSWVSTPLGAGVVVYLSVDDVDAFHERARDAGAVIEAGPEDRPYGRVMMINDPDGYTIGFIEE